MMSKPSWERQSLCIILLIIAAYHLIAGVGLMFSIRFQEWVLALYGAQLSLEDRTIYLLRIIGAFAFLVGFLTAVASRDPLKHRTILLGLIVFFVIRIISRHLYSAELIDGFDVSPLVNDITSVFFGVQAILLAVLLWKLNKKHE